MVIIATKRLAMAVSPGKSVGEINAEWADKQAFEAEVIAGALRLLGQLWLGDSPLSASLARKVPALVQRRPEQVYEILKDSAGKQEDIAELARIEAVTYRALDC